DPARARVGIVDRLSWSLDDAVAQRGGRDPIPTAEADGYHLLAELRYPVCILRVGHPLRSGLHLQRATADRARDVPLTGRDGPFRAHPRRLLPVSWTSVQTLPHRGLG